MAREEMMKAIVQSRYGSPDVLRLEEIAKPVVKDDEVLVRVRAAAVNIGDWHLLRGVPYVMRLVFGSRGRGAGRRDSTSPGRLRRSAETSSSFVVAMRCSAGAEGAFTEYACTAENNILPRPANLTLEQSAAVGDSAFTALAAVRDHGRVQPGRWC